MLVLGSYRTNRSLYIPARILKFYNVGLTRDQPCAQSIASSSHIYFKAVSLSSSWEWGRQAEHTFQEQRRGRGASSCLVPVCASIGPHILINSSSNQSAYIVLHFVILIVFYIFFPCVSSWNWVFRLFLFILHGHSVSQGKMGSYKTLTFSSTFFQRTDLFSMPSILPHSHRLVGCNLIMCLFGAVTIHS